MIQIVELMAEDEFADLGGLKASFAREISESLAGFGYAAEAVDRSDWYSFERKILVDTNAPAGMVERVLSEQNRKLKKAKGVLVP